MFILDSNRIILTVTMLGVENMSYYQRFHIIKWQSVFFISSNLTIILFKFFIKILILFYDYIQFYCCFY